MKLMKKFIFVLMICGSASLYPMKRFRRVTDEALVFVLRRVAPQRFVDQMLFESIRFATVSVVDSFLRAGADVNAIDSFGWTVLMHAIEEGKLDKVKLLLEKGAYLNSVSFFGKTALNSVHTGEVFQLLLNQMSRILNAAAYFEADHVINEEVKESIKNIDFTGIDTIGMLYEVLNQHIQDALDSIYLEDLRSIEILKSFHMFARRHPEEFPGLEKEINQLMNQALVKRAAGRKEETFKETMHYQRTLR